MVQKCYSVFEKSVNKVSVLTVIVSGAQRVLTRRLADPVGGNGSAPFAQLLPEVPVHTYASTTSVVPAFQSIRFNMRGNSLVPLHGTIACPVFLSYDCSRHSDSHQGSH